MAVELFNNAGLGAGNVPSVPNLGAPPASTGASRISTQSGTMSALQTQDQTLAQQAKAQAAAGNPQGAQASINQIQNPALRLSLTQVLITGADGSAVPPDNNVADGIVGIQDPLKVFFMLVFYLNSTAPSIVWDNIIKAATQATEQANNNNLFTKLATLNPASLDAVSIGTSVGNGVTGSMGTADQQAAAQANASQLAAQQQRAALNTTPTAVTNPGSSSGIASTKLWPIQSVPVIAGGMSKTVNFDTSTSASTFAEPIIAINEGATPIELSIEFEYLVGLGSLDAMTNQNGAQSNPWGVAEVMAMIYLALSLVYPYQSTNILGAPTGGKNVTPDTEAQKEGAQFPVIFLRHYSLMPFLSPFICKAVHIEPDEGQPLLFGSPNAPGFSGITDLSLPAVRQRVKITLDLVSAHYYLAVFNGDDASLSKQMQYQTSGQTYLTIANALLQNR